jgi:type I restriction enzyme S subunit
MNNKSNCKGFVPQLRFPEFRDAGEWEELGFYDLLDDILDFRGRTPLKLGMKWGDGKIVSLSANNVKNGYINYNAECNLGSQALYEKWMGKVNLKINDIVFTMEAPLGNALLIPDSKKYILSQRVVVFKTKKEVNNNFLIQLIWSTQFQSTVAILATGSTAKGINQKSLKRVRVNIPSEKEQQKIANCLTSLDELITAQTQKLDSLKAHKKGLMQQLFPAGFDSAQPTDITRSLSEAEMNIPKLRFAEFRDAGKWRKKPIKNLLTIGNGRNYKHLAQGDIPVYGTGGYMLSVNDYLYNGESVCIGRKGTIDKPFFLTGKFWTVDTLFYTHLFKKCLPRFIYLCFQNINWKNHNQAGGIPSLSKVIINKIEIKIPLPSEQKKIVACFTSLDKLITAQTKKINTLKTHKKGLMQQLFPSTDEESES